MVEVNDPQLLGATPSAQWRVGSAVEVYSNSDLQWLVGCIVSEDLNGSQLLCILFGETFAQLKQKQLPRSDGQLAVVGTHVRRTPPGWEVVYPGPQLVQPSSGRRCSSLEEAWSMYFEHVKTQVQLNPVRFAFPAQRGTALLVPAAQPPPLQQTVGPQATNGVAHAQAIQSDSITVPPGSLGEPEANAVADQLSSRLIEAEERAEAAQAKVQQLLSELEQVREERDTARRELREALAEIESLRISRSVPAASAASAQGSPMAPGSSTFGALATPPPVPSSWQPPLVAETASASILSQSPVEEVQDEDATPTDGSLASLARPLQPAALALGPLAEAAAPPPVVGSARERRHTENPVDVVVSVPRALTTEEMFEQQARVSEERERRVPPPSRSLRSLAQNMTPSPVQSHVQRLPSAPVSAMSQCGVTLATTHGAMPKVFPQMSPASAAAMQAAGMRPLIPFGGGAALPSGPASLAAPPGGATSRYTRMAPLHGMPQVVPQQQAYWSSYAPMR